MFDAFADPSMMEDVEDQIEQFDTEDEGEDEIEQFGEGSKTICAGAHGSAVTTKAPVAYVEAMNDFRKDSRQTINAIETNDASNNLGEPKFDAYSVPIDASASDSAVQCVVPHTSNSEQIDAPEFDSAFGDVPPHSPEHWPTASYKSGWDTEGIFDEIIADCRQLSPGSASIEECRAIEADEVQGL